MQIKYSIKLLAWCISLSNLESHAAIGLMMKKILLSVLFAFLSSAASAQVDPQINWKMMRLPHFDLVYDAKHQELANLYADRLEDNISFLSTYFEFIPERTVVVIDDRTDLTNGYATPIPYRTIVLYPVLPGPQETISEFGDWARELAMHEYVHILSFEPRRGIVKGLYHVFGNVVTPNLLMPRWWLEGIAVDLETRTSEKGRLRSTYQDGSIRAYEQSGELKKVKLAEINETSIHTWPQGGRPYLFGSLMWSELIARHGQQMIRDLHNRYGGRMPYFLEGPVYDYTGAGYSYLLEQVKTDLTERVQTQIKTLGQAPLSAGITLKVKNGVENFHPVISPDGLKMIFLSKDDSNKRSVRILIRPSKSVPFDGTQEIAEIDQRFGESLQELNPDPRRIQEDEDSPPGGTIQRLAWFPDSKKFVFDKLDTINRYHEVSDLHTFDLSTMKVEQLTKNERAREASVSPNSRQIVFVKLDAGRTHLGLYDLGQKAASLIYTSALQSRISFPLFLSENEVLFSERNQAGQENLKVINLANLQVRTVLSQFPDARFPAVTQKGLLFSSTANGVANIYLASRDLQSAQPLTNTSTYMSSSAMDEALNELYVSELSAQGFQIRSIPGQQSQSLPSPLPAVKPLLADRYPAQKRDVPVISKPEPEDYSVGSYILPHYWLPNLAFYNDGALIGGSTAGADPLAKHAYSLAASYDTKPEDLYFQFLYANNSTIATLMVKALDYETSVPYTGIDFRQQFYQTSAVWELPGISSDLYAGLAYSWIGRDYSNARYTSAGRDFQNAETESHGPSLLASYSNLTMSGAQITPEKGTVMNFAATEYLQGSGMREDFRQYQLSIQQFYSKWLPRHHAVMVRAQGQYIDREVSLANEAFTVAYSPFANNLAPVYIMRGYMNGQFLGKSLANYTLEYRFPIFYLYHGAGTAPLFIKRLHGALVADGISVDGYSYHRESGLYERVDTWKSFWSTGAELKFDLTIGYHFPVTFYLGVYTPHDSRYNEGQRFALGLQL